MIDKTSSNSRRTVIQTLSHLDFNSSDPARRSHFIDNLDRAFRDIGFVVIRDHNVSHALQRAAYEKVAAFFALPVSTKEQFSVRGIGGARGYTPFGKEHAKNTPVGDLKEFFHVGMEIPSGHPLENIYPKNVSVPLVEGLDSTLRDLYNGLLLLGRDLLKSLAISLKLREDYFEEKILYGNSILRPIHYPPLSGEEEPNAIRSAAHEDINLITLLIGASSPGLEVYSRLGEWIPIQTEPDEIVVNVGDMLQRLTNHYYISTTHRVVNPPRTNEKSTTRFSMPFFLHPVSEMSLEALPSCVPEGGSPKEPPTTAGDYLQERLREIGLL